jgi:hypothetical protein
MGKRFTESIGVYELVELVDLANKDTLVFYRDTCRDNAKDEYCTINDSQRLIWKDLGTFFSKQINRR